MARAPSRCTPAAAAATARSVCDPDADLLRLCAEFSEANSIQEQIDAEAADIPLADKAAHKELWERLEAIGVPWWASIEAIVGKPATTLAGVAAKAEVVRVVTHYQVVVSPGDTLEANGDIEHKLAVSLCNDLLRIHGEG
jgi:hypothetical protein